MYYIEVNNSCNTNKSTLL